MDTNATTPNETPDKNPREKYIRTFAGDMKTMKEGGIPDLAPLVPPGTDPKDRFVATPSVALFPPPPIPTPIPVSALVPAPVEKPIPEPPLAPTPPPLSPPIIAPQTVPPPVTPQPLPPVAPLQTYASDFSEKMKDTHSSAATVLAAEQDSATGAPQAEPPKKSGHGLLYGIAGTVLLIAGGAGAYFAYANYLIKTQPVVLAPVVAAPIFVDEREQLSGTGLGLFQAIEQSVAHPISTGAVRFLYIETSTTTPDSVFSALHMSVPDILLRNINVKGSMAGVVNAGGSQSPFFILSVASYSETFAGMLQWEPTMLKELQQIFPTPIESTPTPTLLATSTPPKGAVSTASSTPIIPAARQIFLDETVANHDVRVYRDSFGQGQDLLLYGYWDQTTLVIARDAAAFTEILQRLATSRAQ